MNRRLDQLEKKFDQQTGADFCRHGGHVQTIEKDPDGSWEHKKTEPVPCSECGLLPPVELYIIIDPERVEGDAAGTITGEASPEQSQ